MPRAWRLLMGSAAFGARRGTGVAAARTVRVLPVLLLASAMSAPAAAHDLEKTQITLTFVRGGSFVLDVSNDTNWVVERLRSIPGSFADRVVLWVDGREIRADAVERLEAGGVTIHRLRGRMPRDARTLRFYYGLVADPYPLTVRRADGRIAVEEIAGDAWSGTIDLAGQFNAPRIGTTVAASAVIALLLVPMAIRAATKSWKTPNHERREPTT